MTKSDELTPTEIEETPREISAVSDTESDFGTKETATRDSLIIRILRDNSWQFVGVVVAILATLVAYYIFSQEREVKALQIVILANTSLVEIEPIIAEDIRLIYRDEPAVNLSLIQVKVENVGNQAIRSEDYVQPIRFVFPSEVKIVEASVSDSNPPNIGMKAQIETNAATLSPVLLNAGDRVIFRFIVVNMPADIGENPFQIEGARIVDVQSIDVIQAIEEKTGGSLSINLLLALALLGAVYAGSVGFISFQMRSAQLMMGHVDKQLAGFPASFPELTPADIVQASRKATITYMVWLGLFVLFVIFGCAGIAFIVFRS